MINILRLSRKLIASVVAMGGRISAGIGAAFSPDVAELKTKTKSKTDHTTESERYIIYNIHMYLKYI